MMFRKHILLPFFLLLFFSGSIYTAYCSDDDEVDRLVSLLSNTKEDTTKVNILIKLSNKTSWSDIHASEQFARQALMLSQQINYIKGLGYANFQLATIFADNEFDFAETLILQSLDHAREINDSILIAGVYNVLGKLKIHINQNEDALGYFNKSLGIFLRHDQDSSAAAIYSNFGILLSDSLSISYFLKAAEINKKTKNYLWLAANYMNIGYEYIELGKLKKGLDYLHLSLDIAKKHNIDRLFPWIYSNFAKHAYTKESYQEAVDYANKALLLSREQGNILQERDALIHLKKAYFKMSDLGKAFDYSEQLKIVTDSINKHSRLKEIDMLELRYKFEEERKAQELEKAILEARHYKKELIYVLVILGSGMIIFTFVFLYILQRNKNRRKSLEQKATILENEKLSQDLEYKNKELTTNVVYTIQKNKTLSVLTEDLLEIQSTAVRDETKEAIKKISEKIQKSLDSEIWEEFEIRFQQVHLDFYKALDTYHPDLTPNEKRLCAFLRMDMTSKEISRITGQSLAALQIARNRLRKKLGISQTDTNLVTFLSQY